MPRYSEGPWVFRKSDVQLLQVSQLHDKKKDRIEAIGIMSPSGYVLTISHDPEDGYDLVNAPEEHAANLQLASAAPEMLALLQRVAAGNDSPELRADIAAVIAKAIT